MVENLKIFLVKEQIVNPQDKIIVHQSYDSFVVFSINNYSTQYTADLTPTKKFKANGVRISNY